MSFSDSMFMRYINFFGKEVEVITKTPQEDEEGNIVKTAKGKIVYDEETSTVTAGIMESTGNETLFNNATKQEEGLIGVFFKEDQDKLNSNSRIIYKDKILYMGEPVERETHFEVRLEEIKI